MQTQMIRARFDPGKIVSTPACNEKVPLEYAFGALMQHLQGQWGLVDDEDGEANEHALKHGLRLLSVYPLPDAPGNFWIITEADRSVTTLLLPSDY